MSIWLIVGSSPSALQPWPSTDVVMTTNRGLELCTPDVYFVSDMEACRRYSDRCRHVRHKVTLQRRQVALVQRNVHWFDEFVRGGHPYEPFQVSGLWCVEYAIRSGAKTVHLVGCEGYRGNGKDYFDNGPNEKNGDLTQRVIEPLTNRLCQKYPEVQFVCHGNPAYRVDAPNWVVQ